MTSFKYFLVCFLALAFSVVQVQADERIGSFQVLSDLPKAIVLDGEITINTPLEFRRALDAQPNAEVVMLNSPGGLVASALILADDIYRLGLSTVVPSNAICFSACAYVFTAGKQRLAEGRLGVHQMWSEAPDSGRVQSTISDVLEALDKFGTPTEFITRMFRTPSDDMYIFSSAEIDELRINRIGAAVLELPSTIALNEYDKQPTNTAPDSTGKTTAPIDPPPTLRLAVYTGLDFYGADIRSERAEDSVQCASSCLLEQQCIAFTFNANPRFTKGPNCFLKNGADKLEAYRDAISGLFIRSTDREAPEFSLGAIDPLSDLSRDTELVGSELWPSPLKGVRTAEACRSACVAEAQCVAFSFANSSKQCRLKTEVSRKNRVKNVISGTKYWRTFVPDQVISLSE